jgi:hypothetical protein
MARRFRSLPVQEPGTLRTVFFLRVVVLVDFLRGADLSGSGICSAVASLLAGAFASAGWLAFLLLCADRLLLDVFSALEVLVVALLAVVLVLDPVLVAAVLLAVFFSVDVLLVARLPLDFVRADFVLADLCARARLAAVLVPASTVSRAGAPCLAGST